MSGGYRVTPGDPLEVLLSRIDAIQEQLLELQRPDGGQVAGALAQVQALILSLPTLVNNVLAVGFTTGSMTATSNITAGGTIVGNVVKTTSGPTTNITAARVASWLQNSDGLIGMATSSERFKSNIRAMASDPAFDPEAVLALSVDYWEYTAEMEKRDDPGSAEYVGPDYHVAQNFGPIAERAHELGLWMVVVYEREDDGSLRLNEAGEPIPFGLHESLFGYLLLPAIQSMNERLLTVEKTLGL